MYLGINEDNEGALKMEKSQVDGLRVLEYDRKLGYSAHLQLLHGAGGTWSRWWKWRLSMKRMPILDKQIVLTANASVNRESTMG